MDLSNSSPVEHLMINRVEIVSEGCRACGQGFPLDPAGVRALSVAVGQTSKTYVFCEPCGEAIMNRLQPDVASQRYQWDWVVPLLPVTPKATSDAALEEMAQRERDQADSPDSNGAGFRALGKTYDSERAAIISFLTKVRASEANGHEAFAAWAAVCSTESLKTGIRMIAEREACHARIFDRRLSELGVHERAPVPEEGRRFSAYLGDPSISDSEKLVRFVRSVGDPEASIKPIRYFAALIREDVQTREALLLLSEDELSSATWAHKSCAALNRQPKQTATA
jgi:hypothetical protein